MEHQPDPDSTPARRLSAADTEQFTTVLAELTAAELPLAGGLRAAAQETGSRRLAAALRGVATQLEQGRTLTEVLADPRQPLPPHIAGLLTAGLRSGRLATGLAELFEQQRTAGELRRSALGALAYPAVLLAITLALFALMSLFISAPMQSMFEEFGVQMDAPMEAKLWIATKGVWLFFVLLGVALVLLLVLRPLLGAARWQFLLSNVPLIGPIWHWTGVADAVRLLTVLIEQQIPLTEALTLTAGGARNAYVAAVCGRLARELQAGQAFSAALAASGLPPLVAPLVRWGELVGDLPAALSAAGDAYESRARGRIDLMRVLLPPVVFILIGTLVALTVIGLFTPMLKFINALTSF